ncbi:MAG: aspartate carbamoyltransferase regulatory subunit [Candidatus Delongbacteria bacterium]|jgi:aspartate carbamoyltransferase regulatory subunit|nr:aspartate carbamoyltransferase regulatory subunit [Candidatus Delongbacteria bacterium]
MAKQKEKLTVSAIKNGTVIDHIPAENLFKALSILHIDIMNTTITIGNNLESSRLGKKGIIKIADKQPSTEDMNKIALVAPTARINIIQDYEVVDKYNVKIPEQIRGIFKCMNPKCITNVEKMTTKFDVIEKDGKLQLKCKYCEKDTDQEHFETI